ncbi:hypothetical protein PoB_003617300 [Plakobranchus ocellatus]|uniref:Uncharacterized protein n=1 Tax=Plakobranchus ocellatus TaxID=259542 RepID=A0AAV4AQN6_9GAST|nr:hypothetical protein PoB_003617300 [Plakobranchus ocellatus]
MATKKGHSFSKVPARVNAAQKGCIRKVLLEHPGEGWEEDAKIFILLSVVSGTERNTTDASSSHHGECECDCLSEELPADRI